MTPCSWTYELRGQEKKNVQNLIKSSQRKKAIPDWKEIGRESRKHTPHTPTKTNSETDMHPLKALSIIAVILLLFSNKRNVIYWKLFQVKKRKKKMLAITYKLSSDFIQNNNLSKSIFCMKRCIANAD